MIGRSSVVNDTTQTYDDKKLTGRLFKMRSKLYIYTFIGGAQCIARLELEHPSVNVYTVRLFISPTNPLIPQ